MTEAGCPAGLDATAAGSRHGKRRLFRVLGAGGMRSEIHT